MPKLFGGCVHQVDDIEVPWLSTYVEAGDRYRQIETARACASRIEEQDAAVFRAGRLVRMSAHDDMESRGDGVKIERVNVVENKNRCGLRLDDLGFRQCQRPRFRIHISSHGKNRRESLQRSEYFRIAHVAGMNDQVRTFECTQGLGAQQSMRVRDQANRFGISPFCHSGIMQGDFRFV
jgi:hypothetical protein